MELAQISYKQCLHCRRAYTPASLSAAGDFNRDTFCCHGCATVYRILNENGLNQYYTIKDMNPPSCPTPVEIIDAGGFSYCDDPEFIKEYSPDQKQIRFYLEGIQCTACLWLIEQLPKFCRDAESARLQMANSTVTVWRSEKGEFGKIAQALNQLGYRPHPIKNDPEADRLQQNENKSYLVRIGIAGAGTGNIMILAVSLYAGATGALAEQFRWVSGLIALPVLSYSAWPFYVSCWKAIKAQRISIDIPIVAALLAGIVTSIWGLFTGADQVYFDSLSTLVFLLLSSRYLLRRIQQNQLNANNLQDQILLTTATKVDRDGRLLESIPSFKIKVGDLILIAPQQVIPADGIVFSGAGSVDASVISGESIPKAVSLGSRAEAGCRNLTGTWVLEVTASQNETRLANILKQAEETSRQKSNIEKLSDNIGQVFTLIVMTAAVLVFFWFGVEQWQVGLNRALALIIVSCPCVFGMAIPLTLTLALRNAARVGILIKNGNVIERTSEIRDVFFDKTGTLTEAQLHIDRFETVDHDPTHLQAALAIEKNDSHPIALSLVRYLTEQNITTPYECSAFEKIDTGGVRGTYQNRKYLIAPIIEASHSVSSIDMPSKQNKEHQHSMTSESLKASYGIWCGSPTAENLIARFNVRDSVKSFAPKLIAALKDQGLTSYILSGDQKSVVESCAAICNVEKKNVFYQATPETKKTVLSSLGRPSLMIGDGANDTLALASASVGVAVRGSMEMSLKASDVYLIGGDLGALTKLITLSRLTMRAVKTNLLFSGTYNLIGGALAMSGLMSPLLAAILMPVSSLTVLGLSIFSSYRIANLLEDRKTPTNKSQTDRSQEFLLSSANSTMEAPL